MPRSNYGENKLFVLLLQRQKKITDFMIMKRFYVIALSMVMTAMAMNAQNEVQPYFTVDQLPDLIKCLPAPPAFDSPEFAYDMERFAWGKLQRLDPERAEIARRDAVWSYEALLNEFAEPFGLAITPENTPEIWKLMVTSLTTTDAMRVAPKAYYHRPRPFERFQDKMLTDEEAELSGEGSYPSGHTMRGWTAALLLAEVNPAAANEIFARGWMYGESRVIVGAHWQSDVDASRVAASIGYSALQGSAEFRKQMAKAQNEFLKKTGQLSIDHSVNANASTLTAKANRLDIIKATDASHGTISKDKKKIKKK